MIGYSKNGMPCVEINEEGMRKYAPGRHAVLRVTDHL